MSSNQTRRQFSWTYPATLCSVEMVCAHLSQIMVEFSLAKKDQFAMNLLLREALNNAVIHGCRENPLLSFMCNLTITSQTGKIEVTDEGAGFDWRKSNKAPPRAQSESRRGLFIYSNYADSIEYNATGNCVTLTRIFNRGETHD
jgi:serine/threonine-protein kinase RsbW